MARIDFRSAPASLIGTAGQGWAAVELMLSTAAVFVAAEQVGSAARALELTADYATTRRQFGRPIGAFQAVKHRLADTVVRQELSRSAMLWAAAQEPSAATGAMGASVARAYCSEAFLQTAKDMIQLHGGIGFTWEHDAHLFLRRARATYGLLGGPGSWRDRLIPVLLGEHATPSHEACRDMRMRA